MAPVQQAFQPMTSYLQKVVNNDELSGNVSSSDTSSYSAEQQHHPHSHPHDHLVAHPPRTYSTYIQDAYSHHSAHVMQQSNTPHSAQKRTHDHDDRPDRSMDYEPYPPYVDGLGGGSSSDMHSHMSYDHRAAHHPMERYPASSSEPTSASTYPPDLDTHLKLDSLPIDDDNHHQPRSDASLLNYRETLRGYHTVQSSNLQQQQQHQQQHQYTSRDDHDHGHSRGRHVSSSSPSMYTQPYVDDARDSDAARRSVPYQQNIQHIHPSSSIPMSNRPPPLPSARNTRPQQLNFESDQNQNLNLRHDHLEDIYPSHSAQHHHGQSQSQNRHVNVVASSVIPSLSTFHPTTGGSERRRRNTSASVSDVNLPLPLLVSLPLNQQQHSQSHLHSHPRSRSTPDPLSHDYNHPGSSSPPPSSSHSHSHYHNQREQQQNISAHASSRHQHARSPLPYPDHKKLANEDRREEPYGRDMDPQSSSMRINVPGQADGLVSRSRSDDAPMRNADVMSGPVDLASDPGLGPGPGKKKKKSKMHECEICQKKFPRPSGLKTHMNTHNNERPYPCGFPGCTRTFGVRSNAKRHLRTHGVIPPPALPGEVPYVVGFDTPVVLPPHLPDGHEYTHGVGGGGGGLNAERLGGAQHDKLRQMGVDGGVEDRGQHGPAGQRLDGAGSGEPGGMGGGGFRPAPRIPTFKVRWMSPSLTTRTNAQELHEVMDRDGQEPMHHDHDRDTDYGRDLDHRYRLRLRHDYDHEHGHSHGHEHEDEDEQEHGHSYPNLGRDLKGKRRWREDGEDGMSSSGMELNFDKNVDDDEMDEDVMYTDRAMANSRLRHPVNLQSHSSPFDTGDSKLSDNALVSGTRSESASSIMVSGSGLSSAPSCMCSPPCPADSSGSIQCRMLEGGSGYGISPSNSGSSARSFIAGTPSSNASGSLSPVIPPVAGAGGYSGFEQNTGIHGEVNQAQAQGLATGPQPEERLSYHQAESYPYRALRSQHRDKTT